MTAEPTATELVNLLRDETYTDWKLEADAADLLERQAEQITHLNDATDRGRRDSWPADAGEFAARWNAKTCIERDEWVGVLIETQLARERLEREIEQQADLLAAAEAKIAQVHKWNADVAGPYSKDLDAILSASPVSALDTVRADAWDEGCDMAYDAAERDIELPTNPYRARQTGAGE